MENEEADAGRDGPNPSREAKFSGANGDREMFIFPVQLTSSRIGNHTGLIHTLLKVLTIHILCTYLRLLKKSRKCNCSMALTST